PLQFLGIAQLVGFDDLVEPGGVGLVVRAPPFLRLRLRGAVFGGLLGVAGLALVLELGRRRLDRVHRALVGVVGRVVRRLPLHRFLGLLFLALPFRFVRLLGRLFLVLVVGILRIRVRLAREAERGQKL